MANLIVAIGVMLILAGVSALVLGTVRHFFPAVEPFFPESFKRPLSFTFGSYYVLAGLMCLLVVGS